MQKIKRINLSDINTPSALITNGMFDNCIALEQIDFPQSTMKTVSLEYMFNNCSNLVSLDLSNMDMSETYGLSMAFFMCKKLKTIIFPSNFNFSKIRLAQCAFQGCEALVGLNTTYWDTSTCTGMESMFQDCKSLTEIDVSNWNTSKVSGMAFMFYGASDIKELDMSNWDVSQVTTLDHFAAHAFINFKGVENWKTTSLVVVNAALHSCTNEELDLSGWDVSKVQYFCQMFENSPNLKRIKGLNGWDASAGLGFDGMFERCYKLEEVDLSSFNTSKAKNGLMSSYNGHKTATLQNMFLSCNNLKKVTVGPNFAINGDGTNTAAANKAILPTPSADYIEGADGNWYTFIGDSYAPNAMKDKTAETYYASPIMVFDADVIVKNGSLIDIAKAIREKNGTTTKYTPAQFGEAIRAL